MKTDIRCRQRGFSLIELIIAMAIIVIVGSLAMSFYTDYSKDAAIDKAVSEIRMIQLLISNYHRSHHANPASLATVGVDFKDPWGNDYRYYDIEGGGTQTRKDKNLTPINTDYDLYSMGPDGASALPLTAKMSKDDIVRANNGSYIGPADGY